MVNRIPPNEGTFLGFQKWKRLLGLATEFVDEASSVGAAVAVTVGIGTGEPEASGGGASRSAGCLAGRSGNGLLARPPSASPAARFSEYPISPRLTGRGSACGRCSGDELDDAAVDDEAVDAIFGRGIEQG